jgi:hypothetical protein
MPQYTCVYYELNRIEHTVEAKDPQAARRKSRRETNNNGWDACDEITHGTKGVEEVLDAKGHSVWLMPDAPPKRLRTSRKPFRWKKAIHDGAHR